MKLVVGHGYLGSRVAKLWQSQGDTVFVTTRDPQKVAALEASGLRPIVCDVANPASLVPRLPEVNTVVYAVGFDPSGDKGMREVCVGGLKNVLNALPASTKRVIYISTTGVYGQDDGSWINEDSPCQPSRESGRVFLEAEEALQTHAFGQQTIILRLAGIYGPGRIPSAEDLRVGKAIQASANAYLNLIHVDDAAQIVVAVEAHAKPPRTYLVADGHPVVRREFYSEVSHIFRTPPLLFEAPTAGVARRGNTSKRVSNARLLSEVSVEFKYRTYREGLSAIADNSA
jgi:nucleoside-diphosphate-sugar epimerase